MYSALDFTAVEWTNPPDFSNVWPSSRENWFACERCHDLIEAEDVEGLVRRSVEEYDRTRAASDPAGDEELRFFTRALFSNFLAARQGGARRVEQQRSSDPPSY